MVERVLCISPYHTTNSSIYLVVCLLVYLPAFHKHITHDQSLIILLLEFKSFLSSRSMSNWPLNVTQWLPCKSERRKKGKRRKRQRTKRKRGQERREEGLLVAMGNCCTLNTLLPFADIDIWELTSINSRGASFAEMLRDGCIKSGWPIIMLSFDDNNGCETKSDRLNAMWQKLLESIS